MRSFNVLLLLMGAALVALVLNVRELSAGLTLLALMDGCYLKRYTRTATIRKEQVDERDDSTNLVAAVVQGMSWAEKGMVYQIGEGEDRHNPTYVLVGRSVVDTFSGDEFFLPEIEVSPAGFSTLPAFAAEAG